MAFYIGKRCEAQDIVVCLNAKELVELIEVTQKRLSTLQTQIGKLSEEEMELFKLGKKVQVVKSYRDRTGVTLKEAIDFVSTFKFWVRRHPQGHWRCFANFVDLEAWMNLSEGTFTIEVGQEYNPEWEKKVEQAV